MKTGNLRFAYLLGIMAAAFSGNLPGQSFKVKNAKKELHYISGEGPIYFPRWKKLKGWQKELKRKK